jgi:hypothetical protein
MKKLIIACLLAAVPVLPAAAVAADAAAAPASAYSTSDTTIGDLLDNAATRAILDKYLPGFSTAEQIDMARAMTLKAVQPYASDTVTDDALAKIDAELAKLPAHK